MKHFKKIFSFVFAFVFLSTFLFPLQVSANPPYVHVIVISDKKKIATKYAQQMSEQNYNHELRQLIAKLSNNLGDMETSVYNGSGNNPDFNIQFHPFKVPRDIKNIKDTTYGDQIEEVLKYGTVAIIVYDLSDPNLNKKNVSETLKKVMNKNIMPCNCVRFLMNSKVNWNKAISFAPYNTDNYTAETLKECIGHIERIFGANTEALFNSTGTWNNVHGKFENVLPNVIHIAEQTLSSGRAKFGKLVRVAQPQQDVQLEMPEEEEHRTRCCGHNTSVGKIICIVAATCCCPAATIAIFLIIMCIDPTIFCCSCCGTCEHGGCCCIICDACC